MNILENFREYLDNITPEDRIAIYTGPDVDGLSSAAITSAAINRLRQRPVDLFIYEITNRPGLSKKNKTLLYDKKINKLIILDIAIDGAPEETIKILESLDTLILDHHSTTKDLNKRGIIFIKPEFFSDVEPATYPTSKMSYDIFGKATDITDLDWISSLGILSDSAYPAWQDFIDRVARKHNIYYSPDEVWKSSFGSAVTVLNRALLHNPNHAQECLESLLSSSGPNDLIKSDIKKYKKEVDREISRLTKEFEEKCQRYHGGNTFYYEISSQFGVCSTLSTILGHGVMQPYNNLIVAQPIDDKCIINLRRNDKKINLAEIARQSVQGFADSSGGGHIPAAGAEIRSQDLPKYKKRLLDIIGSVKEQYFI